MSMKVSLSMRAVFLIRTIFTLVSHGIYLTVWFIFFHAVRSINGWGINHVLFSYGIGLAAYGVLSYFACGIRTMPQQIDNGELDIYLVQPRPVLLNIAMGSPKNAGLIEIITGVALCAITAGSLGIGAFHLIYIVTCACLIFVAMALAYGSLGFWLKDFHSTAEELHFNFNIMASRPPAAFSGALQVLVLTLMPVAFMTHVPLGAFGWPPGITLAITGAMTLFCLGLSYAIFYLGLRRYESGNRFSSHA